MKFIALYKLCKERNCSFVRAMFLHLYYKQMYHLNLVVSNAVSLVRADHIQMNSGRLEIGLIGPEFVMKDDPTLLYCNGNLHTYGNVRINKGSRICVTPSGCLSLNNCFINSDVKILCEHAISIGDGTAIGWGTQICDDDYHFVSYANQPNSHQNNRIRGGVKIGNHVLVGNNCFIYDGVEIADGCVVASNSVLKKSFTTPNMLIAGNPAREIRLIENWT